MISFDTLIIITVIGLAIILVLILCCCRHCRRKVRTQSQYRRIGSEEAIVRRTTANPNRNRTEYGSTQSANFYISATPTNPNVSVNQCGCDACNANALLRASQQNQSQKLPKIKNTRQTVANASGYNNYLEPSPSIHTLNTGLSTSTRLASNQLYRSNQSEKIPTIIIKNSRQTVANVSGQQSYLQPSSSFAANAGINSTAASTSKQTITPKHNTLNENSALLPNQRKAQSHALNRNNDQKRLRKFDSPCITTWNRGEQFYHCITCSRAKKLTICKDCFGYSEHSRHKYRQCKSEFNGSCDCGDSSVMTAELFCAQHADCNQNLIIYKTTFKDSKQVRKMSMLLNVTADEAKRLAQLNKLESVCELAYKGKIIKDYFNNSQVHSNMNINITNVYAVYRGGQEISFKRNDYLNETRMLLWHGTKRENLKGIFDTGLKLPLSGGMFGNGIYFADRVTKSANYTDCGYYQGFKGNTGVLLLCEVAVGNMLEVISSQTHLTEPPNSYQSVKGLGKNQPSSTCTYTKKNIIVPLGTTTSSNGHNFSLQYNEYIVYDPRRVLIKFFVEFERN